MALNYGVCRHVLPSPAFDPLFLMLEIRPEHPKKTFYHWYISLLIYTNDININSYMNLLLSYVLYKLMVLKYLTFGTLAPNSMLTSALSWLVSNTFVLPNFCPQMENKV